MRVAPAPLGPALVVVEALGALTWAAGRVVAVGGLLLIVALAMLEEVVGPMTRAQAGLYHATAFTLILVAVVTGVVEVLRRSAVRTLRLRTASSLARSGGAMPPAVERRELVRGGVEPVRLLLSYGALMLGTTAALVGLVPLEPMPGAPSSWIAGAGLAVAAGMLLASLLVDRAHGPWRARLARMRLAWPTFHRSDVALGVTLSEESGGLGRPARVVARRALSPVDRTLRWALVGAVATVGAGVLVRMPCRGCEPIAYDPYGESVVDGLAAVGLVLVAVVATGWIVRTIGVWMLHVRLEAESLERAERGTLVRTPWIDRALGEPRSIEQLARVVAVAAAIAAVHGLAPVVGAVVPIAIEARVLLHTWPSSAGTVAVLAALAVVVGAVGVVATHRWRTRIHPHVAADPLAGRVVEPATVARS